MVDSLHSTSGPGPVPWHPGLGSMGANGMRVPLGVAPLKDRCLALGWGGRTPGVVSSAVRLQARAARAQVAVDASAEGGGPNAGRIGVAGRVGVARAGVTTSPPAKRRRIVKAIPQVEGMSSPSLADLARLAARSGGLI